MLRKTTLFLFVFIFTLFGEILDLAKQSTYSLGTGEKLSLYLDFPKGEMFEFKTTESGPFTLKKLSSTKLELNFNAQKLRVQPSEKQNYQANFNFTNLNTGRKSSLTARASFEPSNKAEVAKVEAVKEVEKPKAVEKVVEQQSKEMLAVAEKAQKVAEIITKPNVETAEAPTDLTTPEDGFMQKIENLKISNWIYLVVIAVLILLVIILLIKSMVPTHTPTSEGYEELYKDIATILNVSVKGRSIDNCSTEILQKLIQLTQTNAQNALNKTEANRAIKPVNTTIKEQPYKSSTAAKSNFKSAMSSQFIDPSYNNPINNTINIANKNSGTLRIKNKEEDVPAKPLNQASNLSYQNADDYFNSESTISINQQTLNKINREIKEEEDNPTSVEEKKRRIEEVLGRKKFD